MQSSLTSFWRSLTGLVQLIFSFPSWFHTIWFYCSHTFHSFLSQLHSAFRLDWNTWSQCSHVFRLTDTAALHCGHSFVGGILTVLLPMTDNWICKERLSHWSENKTATIQVVQIHTQALFPRSKKWLTRHIAVPTGNAQASQKSIFRENRLKFSTFIRCWEGYYR